MGASAAQARVMASNITAARFWSKVEVGTSRSCWNWRAGLNNSGYGVFRYERRYWKAHRVAWLLSAATPLGESQVLHSCDNPRCCNPNHLFLGDNAANVADKVSKGRQARGVGHGVPGARNKQAKLTAADVVEIKARLAAGEISQRRLAAHYGVSQAALSLIVTGKNWARPEALLAQGK